MSVRDVRDVAPPPAPASSGPRAHVTVRRPSRWWRLVPLALLIAGGVYLVGATLEPDPSAAGVIGDSAGAGAPTVLERILGVLHSVGVSDSFGFTELEVLANVLVFIPIGLLAALALPRRGWWIAALGGTALSVAIEFAQHVAVTTRVPTLNDVIANSAGVLIGVLAAVILRALASTTRRRNQPSESPIPIL